MAFTSKSGDKFSNADSMRSQDAMSSRKAPAAPEQQGPPPIESDPEAMQCVQILQQKGYTADDVEQAMGQSEGSEQGGMSAGAM